MPAFGVTIDDFAALREIGCMLVDTTCGSVLNVWKRVEAYARDGFTALIHGKYYHEETRATASQVRKYPTGTTSSCATWTRRGWSATTSRGDCPPTSLMATFAQRGVAGLRSRRGTSSASASRTRRRCWRASRSRSAKRSARRSRARAATDARATSFRSFDTICSATQERQDAVRELLADGVDVMVVIGGFNSSNTISLAALCAERVPTYHIETSSAIDPETRHDPLSAGVDQAQRGGSRRLAARRSRARGRHCRREHAEQQDRRRRRADSRDARTARSGVTIGAGV